MIERLKPYPEYKDSGVPWLGPIPETWAFERIKTVLRERVEKGHQNEPLLAATQTKGVVRKQNYASRTVLALKDLELLNLVMVGDFVISLRSFEGNAAAAEKNADETQLALDVAAFINGLPIANPDSPQRLISNPRCRTVFQSDVGRQMIRSVAGDPSTSRTGRWPECSRTWFRGPRLPAR